MWRYNGGGRTVRTAVPLSEAGSETQHQHPAAAAEDARELHLELGGDGETETVDKTGPVHHFKSRQEYLRVHPVRGRNREPRKTKSVDIAIGQHHD